MISHKELVMELEKIRLTKSQQIILKIIRKNGRKGLTPKQLLGDVNFAARTVRYGLRKLLKKELIKRIPCLEDMRQWIYLPA